MDRTYTKEQMASGKVCKIGLSWYLDLEPAGIHDIIFLGNAATSHNPITQDQAEQRAEEIKGLDSYTVEG